MRTLLDSWIWPCRSGSPGAHELVAGDDDGDARPAVAAQLGDAAGRDGGQRERAQPAAGRDDDGVRGDVGAAPPHVVAERHRAGERDAVAVDARALDRDDRVRSLGQRRARRDRHRGARLEPHRIVAGERSARRSAAPRPRRPRARRSRPWRSCRRAAGRAPRARRRRRCGPRARSSARSVSAGSGASRSSRSARASSGSSGRGVGSGHGPDAINGRVDDGPVAPRGGARPLGPGARRRLPRRARRSRSDPAVARPAWWDAGAPAQRVAYVRAGVRAPPAAAVAAAPRARLLRRARARARAGARGRAPRTARCGRAPSRCGPTAARSSALPGGRRRAGRRPARARDPAAHAADRPSGRRGARRGRRGRARGGRGRRSCSSLLAAGSGRRARHRRARSRALLGEIAAAVPDTTRPGRPPQRAAARAPAWRRRSSSWLIAGGSGAYVFTAARRAARARRSRRARSACPSRPPSRPDGPELSAFCGAITTCVAGVDGGASAASARLLRPAASRCRGRRRVVAERRRRA